MRSSCLQAKELDLIVVERYFLFVQLAKEAQLLRCLLPVLKESAFDRPVPASTTALRDVDGSNSK